MRVKDVIKVLDDLFPLDLQESYDNAGHQVVFPDRDAGSILLALDIDEPVIDEALQKGCRLIITHHPLFFTPLKNIVSGNPKSEMILKLVDNRVSVFSAHTNLDKIYYSKLSERLGFTKHQLLIEKGMFHDGSRAGFGTLSEMDGGVRLTELLSLIKSRLNLEYVLYTGPDDPIISRIAILNGSGGNSIQWILDQHNVDCIITGDIGYHNSRLGLEYTIPVIDAGHFGTEKILIDFLKNELDNIFKQDFPETNNNIFISEKEKNPIRLYV